MKRLLVGLLLAAIWATGCSEGDTLPLVAPGGSDVWPADGGWRQVGGLLAGGMSLDGVADPQTGTIVVVGTWGAALEYRAGRWIRSPLPSAAPLRSVVSLGGDEFLAVGDGGGIWHRSANGWAREESGTGAGLRLVYHASGGVWAVGDRGTVLRRDVAGWQSLPAPTRGNLVGATVVHDSLFVVGDEEGNDLLAWDGEQWRAMSSGPWGTRRIVGIASLAGETLYAAADSFYVREATGWRTITDNRFWESEGRYALKVKIVDHSFWYRYGGSWYAVDPAVAPRQPAQYLSTYFQTIVPLGGEDFLEVSDNGQVGWVESGQRHQDPVGELNVLRAFPLSAGGFVLETGRGIAGWADRASSLIISAAVRDSVLGGWAQTGCGRDTSDFYLGTGHGIHHYLGGQLTTVASWDDNHDFKSLVRSEDGQFHLAGNDGLWRWTGTELVPSRPLGVPEDTRYTAWSSGAGDVVAEDGRGYYYRWAGESWLPLGYLRRGTVVLATTDGTLIAVRKNGGGGDNAYRNTLLVHDNDAGVFRDLGALGMGVLADLDLKGGVSLNGELLVWTATPSMVFRLNGNPRNANWELVAGPLAAGLGGLTVLPDGSLLGLDTGMDSFHLYER